MLLCGHALEHYENWLNYVVQSILLMSTYAYYMTFLKHIYNIFDNFSIWCVAEGIANSKNVECKAIRNITKGVQSKTASSVEMNSI